MRLLALETSEYVSSLALWENGAIVSEQTFPSRMDLCEHLTRRLQEMLGVERACEADLDGLAVSLGPGSFTGLRVGVATAKALAQVCGWPLVGVATQEAIAFAAEIQPGERLIVLQKARQGHVYAGQWEECGEGVKAVADIQVLAVGDLPSWLGEGPCLVTGPAAGMLLEAVPELPEGLRLEAVGPTARAVAHLAAGRLGQAAAQSVFTLQPLYLLPSQAERMKNLDLSQPQRTALTVRRGTLDDLDAIMVIEEASFSTPWPRMAMQAELSHKPEALYLTVNRDEQVVAYLGSWLILDEGHICTVAVAPEARRGGLGELMLLVFLQHATRHGIQKVFLEYRTGNTPAAKLYQKIGFTFIGLRRGYYADTGEDAVVVSLAGLDTPAVQQHLSQLWEAWQQSHDYDLSCDV
jgi:[ribosomal protein S18]-alanine N-acetyltransferase